MRRRDGGVLDDGIVIPLPTAPDLASPAAHGYNAQNLGINGGLMNGFSLIKGCSQDDGYRCYEQCRPDQVPNLAELVRTFGISDRTFETRTVGSWGSHLVMAASHLDGFFTGYKHPAKDQPRGPGWGCDSYKVTNQWRLTPYDEVTRAPTCVPKPDGSGEFEPTPVPWVPTIMDRLETAGVSWKIYAPEIPDEGSTRSGGYGWAICPTFANCL